MLRVKKALKLFTLAALSSASAHAYDLPTKSSTDAAFKPGDTLKIEVLDENELSQYYAIDASGMILFPMLGRIKLEGKTPSQAEEILTHLLKDGYILNPVISIDVHHQNEFYILGEVKNPGRYNLPRNASTILNAVAMAGGFTIEANTKEFEIVRNPDDQDHYTQKTTAYTNIMPGDIIIVKEHYF